MGVWNSRSFAFVIINIVCFSSRARGLADSKPSAVSIPVRTDWLGYDGVWSPVSIRIGTPPQWVDVFVSTASQETWVIGPGGCDGTVKCLTERGGIFRSNESSTWQNQGPFGLGLDPQLGFGDDGVYGFDSIALSDQISVPSQVVAVINTTDYWLGSLGLGVKPTNFTSTDKPTFLDSMVENQSLVPSHSYGFTAGAHYRLKSVPSSLIVGGFDANRFEPHNVTFDLDPNQNPVVTLNEIVVTVQPLPASNVSTGWATNSMTLLGSRQADMFTIDSSTPYLWMPEAVCLQFEKAFGLTYDENLQLYTFGADSSIHENMVNWNISFQFMVTDLPGSSKSVSLTLPYAAFDLQLSYPYPGLNATESSAATNYFPLRKAANNTQYTIGRSFLQETYLKVDYERNNFSIYQATFSPDALQNTNLIDITRPKNSTFKGPEVSQSETLSRAVIAGTAVGAAAVLAFLIGLTAFCLRARRNRENDGYIREKGGEIEKSKKISNNRFVRWLFHLPKPDAPSEVLGSSRLVFEAPTGREIMELPAKLSRSELSASEQEIPAYQEADRKYGGNVVNAIGHDPEKPVELPYRSSAPRYSGRAEIVPRIHFASQTNPPARPTSMHHLSRQNTQTTAGISSPSNAPSKRSSKESSPIFIVSPVTPREASPQFSSLSTIARREAWYVLNDSRGGHTSGASVLSNDDPARSDHALRSNESTVTNQIRQSVSRGFSWEPGESPEREISPITLSMHKHARSTSSTRWYDRHQILTSEGLHTIL